MRRGQGSKTCRRTSAYGLGKMVGHSRLMNMGKGKRKMGMGLYRRGGFNGTDVINFFKGVGDGFTQTMEKILPFAAAALPIALKFLV